MSIAIIWLNNIRLWLLLLVALTCMGCVSGTGKEPLAASNASQNPTSNNLSVEAKSQEKTAQFLGTIAVSGVTVEHPTARLVYKDNVAEDTVVRQLQQVGSYRVIDGKRLKQVLVRRNLHWSDLQDNAVAVQEISDVLLNDFFLQATISSYGERFEFSSSAFSKSKTQVVSTTVEFMLKDALTNEIIATSKGEGEQRKQITQTLGFGAAGGVDTVLAQAVLDQAIGDGVARLSHTLALLDRAPKKEQVIGNVGEKFKQAPSFLQDRKVLFIVSEVEEVQSNTVKESELKLSVAEHSLAQPFLEAGCRVLTADDVLNRAYSFAGGDNVLSGEWASEQDFLELENLLQARTGIASYAIQVGRTANVDLVVSGEVRHQSASVQGLESLQAKQSTVFLNVKVLSVKDSRVLAIEAVQQRYTVVQVSDMSSARSRAIQLAADRAARSLLPKIQM